MKNIFQSLLYLSALFIVTACGNNTTEEQSDNTEEGNTFSIHGKIEHPNLDSLVQNASIIFSLADYNQGDNTKVLDTVKIAADGSFEIKNTQTEAGLYHLKIDKATRILLAIEGAEDITIDFKGRRYQATIAGSPGSEAYLAYAKASSKAQAQYIAPLYDAYKEANGDKAIEAELDAKYVENMLKLTAVRNEYLKKMGTSIAVFATSPAWKSEDVEMLDEIAQKIATEKPDLKITEHMLAKVDRFKKTAIGGEASDLSYPSPTGEEIALSSLRGQYVLLDFWAAWCGPCRQENPNVVATYQKYKDQGFTVYGVSLDKDKAKWVEAIEKDGLTWTHVSDLKGWGSEGAYQYNISAIPANFLLNKEGKIIGKDLRGKALGEAVAKAIAESL